MIPILSRHELSLYTSTAKIINYIANFVFIVYFQSRVTPGDSWKTPISFFSLRVPFYVPFTDPPKYYYLVGFLRFGNHDQSGPLYDPMSCIPLLTYTCTHTHTHKYIIYMCYILFFYFIVILLYYIHPITYYRCGGSSGGWRVRRYFYIGDIYDRVKDLLSISGLLLSSFALTAYFSVYMTITYTIHGI